MTASLGPCARAFLRMRPKFLWIQNSETSENGCFKPLRLGAHRIPLSPLFHRIRLSLCTMELNFDNSFSYPLFFISGNPKSAFRIQCGFLPSSDSLSSLIVPHRSTSWRCRSPFRLELLYFSITPSVTCGHRCPALSPCCAAVFSCPHCSGSCSVLLSVLCFGICRIRLGSLRFLSRATSLTANVLCLAAFALLCIALC
jgi:hypothetical protein